MKNKSLIMLLFVSFLLPHTLHSKKIQQKNTPQKDLLRKIEAALPTFLTSLWAGTIGIESLCFYNPNIRNMIYSNGQKISHLDKTLLGSIHYVLPLHANTYYPNNIMIASRPWTTLAGHCFSNYDTLFISEKVIDAIKQLNLTNKDTLKNSLKSWDKKELQELLSALIMIETQYDAKVLKLSIITPLLIWSLVHGADYVLQKYSTDQQSEWLKSITAFTQQCKDSFMIKAGVSASIIATFILYQRHIIALKVSRTISKI